MVNNDPGSVQGYIEDFLRALNGFRVRVSL